MQIATAERERRRALLAEHYDAENEHDLKRIMATFSPGAEMRFNGHSFADPKAIQGAHGYIGMSAAPGAFSGIRNLRDREHITADEIVVEGRLCGTHTGEFLGFPPTQRAVELPFVAFYWFDAKGQLVSERIVMDLGALGASQPAAARS
jgi:predicted ester cyclase